MPSRAIVRRDRTPTPTHDVSPFEFGTEGGGVEPLSLSGSAVYKTAPTTGLSPSTYDSPLDPGIRTAVETLHAAGIATFESCEGGKGHSYAEPTVRFHGGSEEGLHALSVAIKAGLPVLDLRKVWPVIDSEPTGPWWELTFVTKGR